MRRCITFTIAAILTTNIAASAWSQAGQSGGAGTAGSAGTAGTAGAAGTANTPGTSGTAGVGAPSVPPNVNIGANPQGQVTGANPQSRGVGANPQSQGIGANPPTRAPGFGSNIRQTPFFIDPGVRQQLNLNENQFNTLNRAYQEAYGRFNRGVTGLTNNLPAQQRQAHYQQFANQFNNDFGRALDQTFTDPRVRRRYDQLNRQYMGFNAFNDPGIQRQMNLTPQQMVQLRQLSSVWRQQLRQLRNGNGTTNANVNINPQQWNEMYAQYGERLNAVLTPEQRQQWTQLTGLPYTFSPDAFAGPENLSVEGQFSDGTTPVNRRAEATGPERFLLQGGGQTGQNPSNATPQPSQGTAPQGGTASGTQGATVR